MSSPSGNPFGQDISSDESEYVPVYSGQSSSGDEVIVVTTPDFGVTAIDFDVPAILDDGGVLPHVSERVNPRLKSVAEYFATQFLRFGLRTDAQISFKLVRYDMPNQMVPMAQAINILYGIGTKADLRTIQVMAGGGLLPDLDPECSAEEVRRYAFSFQDRLIHYFIASMPWMDEPISKIAKIQLREKKCLYIHEIYEKYGELKFAKFLDKDKKSSLRITPHSFFASMDNIARGMYGPDYAQRFFSPITWGRFWIGILFTFLLTSLPAIAWSAYQSHTKDVMRGEISDLRDTLSNFTRYIGNHTKSIEDREYVLLDFTKSISDHADRLEKRESELDREIYSLAEIINASITVAVPTTTTIVSTTEKLLTTTHTVVKTLIGAPTPIRVTETVVDIVTTPLATTSVATTTSHYDVMEYFGDEIPDRATQIYVICAVTVTAAVVLSFIFMAVRSFSCCRGKKGNRNHDVERNSSYTVFNPSIPVR